MCLLPKKGDLQQIRNWRPVSLLNTDYKIVSKVLAMRLKNVISLLIGNDQTYCIPDRSIYDSIFLVRDLIAIGQTVPQGFGLLLLDQEKAFDSVDHSFLFAVLTRAGFGEKFISCIKILYRNASCLLKVNNTLCHPFPFQCGIRQGCPLSGMLYTLSVEPQLALLRTSLSGLSLSNSPNIVASAYADDLCVVVKNPKDVSELSRCLAKFELSSSARVNWNKSVALQLYPDTRSSSHSSCALLPTLP